MGRHPRPSSLMFMSKKTPDQIAYFQRKSHELRGRHSVVVHGIKPRRVVCLIDAEIFATSDSREIDALSKDEMLERIEN